MQVVSIREARDNLKAIFNSVYHDNDEVIIHRKGHENIVMIPFDEYNSIKETNYLLSSPKNAQRLQESIKELRAGRGLEKELIQCD
jgi:antitoxin YefM